jgi:hypothetical protein
MKAWKLTPSTKNQEPRTVLSSYVYSNDLLGRRETISQGGSAFAGMSLGTHTVEVAYNDRSEVIGAETRRGDTPVARQAYAYDGIGNRTESRVSGPPSEGPETITTYESVANRIDIVRFYQIDIVAIEAIFPRCHRLLPPKWS